MYGHGLCQAFILVCRERASDYANPQNPWVLGIFLIFCKSESFLASNYDGKEAMIFMVESIFEAICII